MSTVSAVEGDTGCLREATIFLPEITAQYCDSHSQINYICSKQGPLSNRLKCVLDLTLLFRTISVFIHVNF